MDSTTEMLDVPKAAIQAEIEGHGFYMMAAQSTKDAQGQTMFQQFAQDELEHADVLRQMYDQLMVAGALEGSVRLPPPGRLANPSAIFSNALRDRIREAHYEMTALSVGVQLEETAMNFYRKHATLSKDEALQDLFNDLYEWERGHFQALLAQLEELKDEYWQSNNFQPF